MNHKEDGVLLARRQRKPNAAIASASWMGPDELGISEALAIYTHALCHPLSRSPTYLAPPGARDGVTGAAFHKYVIYVPHSDFSSSLST